MNNWTKIFSTTEAHKAEIVKDMLADKEFDPVIVNRKDTAYKIFGEYEVYVAPEYAVRALRVIENDISFE